MRKSLITTAVLGTLAAPAFVFAADAARAPDLTVAYNVGLYSQYIFRGLTQTNREPAIQGGVDLTHSSGFYLGAWGSNISWLKDDVGAGGAGTSYYKSGGSIEMDLYGGYRYTFGSGIGIDIGALQYYYPGSLRNKAASAYANTTELYGAISYGWLQAKISGVVSGSAWTIGKMEGNNRSSSADGTYYAELNANIPVSDLIGVKDGLASGVTGLVHVARQEFNAGAANDVYSYSDYKVGLTKAFEGGVNVGGYWTKSTTNTGAWTLAGRNIGDSTGTVFVQKTF
jgi:uncharacterized protein (TIGR02001 family)